MSHKKPCATDAHHNGGHKTKNNKNVESKPGPEESCGGGKDKVREDSSPRIYQREKIDFDLKVRQLPWTAKQLALFELAARKDTRIIFISGPAGTSKTLSAVKISLDLLNARKVSDIVCVRAAVESADSKLGYLPGDLAAKFDVYMMPFADKLEELLCIDQQKRLKADNRIINQPINFCRGLSFTARAIIFDEAQNATLKEIVTLITRIGKFSRMFICADPSQSDLTNGKRGGFEELAALFDDEESREMGIYRFDFTEEDIVRSELCSFIVKKLAKNIMKKESVKDNS